jgi:type II secretory pathway component PulM
MTREPGYPVKGLGSERTAAVRDRWASLWRRWQELNPPETSGAILSIGGAVILLAALIRVLVRPAMQRQRCCE